MLEGKIVLDGRGNVVFKGMLYFFYSFDVGDDIAIKKIQEKKSLLFNLYKSSFYKTYNKPLLLNLKQLNLSSFCIMASLYSFGVISLRYAFPFSAQIEELKKIIHNQYDLAEKHSNKDAQIIFNEIKSEIGEPYFFNLYRSYALIQVNTQSAISPYNFKDHYAQEITSLLRFEIENLSEYKKNEILKESFGYYRGDLLIIDFNSALAYDSECQDILDIFEYANIKHMELQFFDRALDKQLNFSYDRKTYKVPVWAYFPIIGMFAFDPIGELAKLRVDISVVCERLWSSIKFSDEPYYLEIYNMLHKKLEFDTWQKSIDKKLEVIANILQTHEHKVTDMRHDVLNLLIVLLIFLETVLAVLHYFSN
jgi:hypothetical protein